MTEMILLSEAQMARISPFFPHSHGVPRVDDRRVISGIIFVIRNGLRWRDVPASYGPHKTIYNRFIRWSEMGVFGRIFVELAKGGGDTEEIMIDATHRKAHRTAASQIKKGLFPGLSDAQRRIEFETARGLRQRGSAPQPVSDRRPSQRLHRGCSSAVDIAPSEGAVGGQGL